MKVVCTLLVLSLLIIVPTSALAQATDEKENQTLILGISPGGVNMCVRAGDNRTVKFLISTNVDVSQDIIVSFEGQNWVTYENNLQITHNQDYYATFSVPKGTREDLYGLKMLVCRAPLTNQTNATISEFSCISPYIQINVSSGCPAMATSVPVGNAFGAKDYILLAALGAAAVLVLYQVSKIMRGEKQAVRAKKRH
jgi:hypothetical protein